ncbi:hypothetical protein H6P81_000081 [Aristolochia fimbriata]|uniref:F-box domain-containing protein n=1 Tax=Aristolochia fimbriata TaxID=158543 RepID=A0AAV7F3C6_ARIFI|nr:hypothetical protein H6P81_000081 [Aristolochia fimbriata]
MDELPQLILIEILSRLHDAADLSRCRVASKTLNHLSGDVHALTIICSSDRVLKTRSPGPYRITPFRAYWMTPFKSIVSSLIFRPKRLRSISIGFENTHVRINDDREVEADDLWLTSVDFVSEWLPIIGSGLSSLSISDFWNQSCRRESRVLRLISNSSEGRLLNTDEVGSKSSRTRRHDDEYLKKVNECFPSLRVLKLIRVEGIAEHTIHLLQLRICHWTGSNVPMSLTVHAPNLIELKLQCVQPISLVIKSPLLSVFDLSTEKSVHFIDIEEFCNLKTLKIHTHGFNDPMMMIPWGKAVESLVLDAPKWDETDLWELGSIERLIFTFPYLKSVVLGPTVCYELQCCFEAGGPSLCLTHGWDNLKKLWIQLVIENVGLTYSFFCFVLNLSPVVSDVEAVVHWKVADNFQHSFKAKCAKDYPRIKWSWSEWA